MHGFANEDIKRPRLSAAARYTQRHESFINLYNIGHTIWRRNWSEHNKPMMRIESADVFRTSHVLSSHRFKNAGIYGMNGSIISQLNSNDIRNSILLPNVFQMFRFPWPCTSGDNTWRTFSGLHIVHLCTTPKKFLKKNHRSSLFQWWEPAMPLSVKLRRKTDVSEIGWWFHVK